MSAAARLKRLLSVDHEVQHYLFQFRKRREHRPDRRRVDMDGDATAVEVSLAQLKHFADHVAQIHGGRRARAMAAEPRKTANDVVRPIALRLDEGNRLDDALR